MTDSERAIERFLEACTTGETSRRASLRTLGIVTRSPETLRKIAALPHVHPNTQAKFLNEWTKVCAWQEIRAGIGHDDLWFAALRKLMPPFDGLDLIKIDGRPEVLYRGQRKGEPLGMSWTRSLRIAESFALYGDGIPKRGQEPRANGVVYNANASEQAIICAPCLLGHLEGEYIIDPRRISATLFIDWSERHPPLEEAAA